MFSTTLSAKRFFRVPAWIRIWYRKKATRRRVIIGAVFLLVVFAHMYWFSSSDGYKDFDLEIKGYSYTPVFHQKLVDIVNSMEGATEGPVLLTIVNKGYMPLTYNWLCHTARMKGVHENMIFMVQGEDTELKLKERWPRVRTITVNQSENELIDSLVFGTVGYIRMMVRRTELLNSLVMSNISFVLFETDFIWFENPVSDLIHMAKEKDLDIVGTISTAPSQLMCGALIYFRNTMRTRALWGEVTRQTHMLGKKLENESDTSTAPSRKNEQIFMNQLLRAKYSNALYGLVDYGVVVDGKWYAMTKMERKQLRPKAIHNNFLETTPEKLDRFRAFNHWVLDEDDSCNSNKVDELFQRGPT